MKRIAALASIALALTGILAIPAHATGTPVNLITSATGITSAGTTATQFAGPGNIVTMSNTVISGGSAKSVYFTVSGGVTSTGTTSGTLAPGASVFISTPTPTTITVLGYEITNGAATTSPTDTIVITVVNNLPGTVYASSIIYAAASTALPTSATDAAFSVTAPGGAANVANFTVTEVDAAGVAMQAANAKAITIIATNCLVSSPNLAASPSANSTYFNAVPINPTTDFVISGIPSFGGNSTVAISINGSVVKTYTIKFTGQAAKIVLTPINSVIGIGVASSILPSAFNPLGVTANTNALEVQEFDSLGNVLAVNPANISLISSAPSVATAGAFDGVGNYRLGGGVAGTLTSSSILGVSLTGVAVGTATFTATDTTLGLTSAAVPVRVSSGKPTSAVITTNLPNYPVGGLGTISTTVSDAAGPLPAGTYIVFASQAVASIALSAGSASLPGAPATIAGPPAQKIGQITVDNQGVYTFSFNAPTTSAEVTISGTPANSSITITPATFIVGTGATGPAIATTDSANESYNASTSSSDVTTLTNGQADAVDQAAQSAITQTTAVQAVVTAQTALVTTTLTNYASLKAARVKIAAIAKKK